MAIKRVAEGKKKTLKKVFKIHCIKKHERSKKEGLAPNEKRAALVESGFGYSGSFLCHDLSVQPCCVTLKI